MKTAQCEFCARPFRARPNKRYCSTHCRFQAWVKGKTDPEAKPCFYCGMPADTIDHVPPRSVRPIILAEGATRWTFHEVDACHECNCLLGAGPPWTLDERKAKIKEKLRRRYNRYLKIPVWSDAELAQYDKHTLLGSYIHEGVFLQRATQQRLAW